MSDSGPAEASTNSGATPADASESAALPMLSGPDEKREWYRAGSAIRAHQIFTALVLAAVVALLYMARDELGPYILAVILAYLVLPIVVGIERALPSGGRLGRFRRSIATILTLLVAGVAIVLLITFVVKPVQNEMQELADNFSSYWADLTNGQTFGTWYENNIPEDVQLWIADHASTIGQQLLDAIASVFGFLVTTTGSKLSATFTLVIVPVFMAYFLIDRPGTERLIRTLFPENWVDDSIAVLSFSDQIMANYTRGVIVSSAVVGAITGFGYWVIGVDLWIALGAIAFFGEIVPILGPWIAFFISFPIVLVTQPEKAIPATILFGIVQALEGWFISPRIQGESIQMPASAVLLSLAIGGAVAGAMGVVLALPVIALLRAMTVYTVYRLNGKSPAAASRGLVSTSKDLPYPESARDTRGTEP